MAKTIKIQAEGMREKDIHDIKKLIMQIQSRSKRENTELDYESMINGRRCISRKR